jgi:putative multiple sugar transport system permease protein
MSVIEIDRDPQPPAGASAESRVRGVRELLRSNVRQYGMIVALAAITALFQWRTEGILLKPVNVTNLVAQNSYILILAIGMVIVIIAGHIDLSVGSVLGFVSALSAVLIVQHHMQWQLAVVLCLLLGAVAGGAQGYFVAYVGIPSFIVTLAGMLVFRGLTQFLLQGQSIAPFPKGFQEMSNGFLPEVGPNTNYHNLTLLMGLVLVLLIVAGEIRSRRQQRKYGFDVLPVGFMVAKVVGLSAAVVVFTLLLASYKGAPIVLLILAALLVLFSFLMRTSVVGRHAYAVGGNAAAAKLSGVDTRRVNLLVFVNMGMLSALAGLVYAARLNAGTPNAGTSSELEAIAAAFIGGASATGGVGTVLGAIIGGLVLGVLNNGMSLLSIGTDVQQVIKGLVLLAAVGFDVYNKRRGGN